mgnify:CR=1 FL=1
MALVFTITKKALLTARCAHRKVCLDNCRKLGGQPLGLGFHDDEKPLLTARCAHRKVLAEEGAGLVVVGEQDGYFIVAL